ncbi:SdpI family protein [Paludisphaera soli]|uniref:SdpI family protein n=1 Tax=Paludisphaera soli TaxID=2712865 RepID=UPI0013EC23C7|nr:SdpI family protein [Paludisphaera soli]
MTRAYWFVAIGLTAGLWGLSAWCYPGLPDSIPTHWNIHGQVDGHGGKATIFLMPAVTTGLLVLFAMLPTLSPAKFEVDSFRSTYLFILAAIVGLLAYIQVVILLTTYQEIGGGPRRVDMGRALLAGMFVFFGLMGNVMGKVRKNFYIGIRVPWTLSSDRVWNDTHRLAAWLMVAGSVVGLAVVASGAPLAIAFGVLMATVFVPVVYSFFHYKALERRGAL